MQINIHNNLISSLPAGFDTSARVDKNDRAENVNLTVELGTSFGQIIEKAMAEPDDRSIIEQARKALAEGTIDTPLAFESAAESLMRFGI